MEREFAADIHVGPGDGEGDQVVKNQAEGSGDHPVVIGELAEEAGSDGLRNSDRRDAYIAEEDKGVDEVEGADEQRGTCNDKQQRGAAIG